MKLKKLLALYLIIFFMMPLMLFAEDRDYCPNPGNVRVRVTVYNQSGHPLHLFLVPDYYRYHEVRNLNYDTSFIRVTNQVWIGSEDGQQKSRDEGYPYMLAANPLASGSGGLTFGGKSPLCKETENIASGGGMNFRIFGFDGTVLYVSTILDHSGYGVPAAGDVSIQSISLSRPGSPSAVMLVRVPKMDSDKQYKPCASSSVTAGPLCIYESNSGSWQPTIDFYVTVQPQGVVGDSPSLTLDQFRTGIN